MTLGKFKMGIMRATKAEATTPIGILKTPKFHGPGLNLLPTKNTRMKMGVQKATSAAMAPTEKRAPMEMDPPKMRSNMRIPRVVFAQTALTGVLVNGLTCFHRLEKGKQSSRAYAKVTRDAAIIHP